MVGLQRAAFLDALVPILPDEFELGEVADWEESLGAALATDGVTGLLAEDHDRLAGLVIFGLNRDAEPVPGAGEIRALFVHPARSRSGVGRELIAGACARLAAMGYARVTLWSLRDNHGANAFYDRLGFEADGATQTRPSFGAPEVRYARSLPPGD